MKKNIRTILFFVAICLGLVASHQVFAGSASALPASPSGTSPVATRPTSSVTIIELQNPLKTKDMREVFANVVKKAVGIMGTLVLVVFLYGGFMWLTSAGNAEKVKKGAQSMVMGALGVFIILGAYAILSLVFEALGTQDVDENRIVDTETEQAWCVVPPKDCKQIGVDTDGLSCVGGKIYTTKAECDLNK